jgi:MFS family permease
VPERRWLAVSGFVFVALFVAAVLVSGGQLGSAGDPDEQFVSYFSDTTNRVRDIAGGYVLAAAGLAFIVFLANVCVALREHSGERRLPLIALGAGLVFVVLLLAAAAALSAVPTSMAYAALFDEERHEFGPDVARLATQLGFMLLVFAMWAAAGCIAAISLAARSAGIFPAWLVWLGFVAALALLFSFFFMPAAALPIWAFAVSVSMLRLRPTPAPS